MTVIKKLWDKVQEKKALWNTTDPCYVDLVMFEKWIIHFAKEDLKDFAKYKSLPSDEKFGLYGIVCKHELEVIAKKSGRK